MSWINTAHLFQRGKSAYPTSKPTSVCGCQADGPVVSLQGSEWGVTLNATGCSSTLLVGVGLHSLPKKKSSIKSVICLVIKYLAG